MLFRLRLNRRNISIFVLFYANYEEDDYYPAAVRGYFWFKI